MAGLASIKFPALQVALDRTSWGEVERIILSLPSSSRIIIEAGTPLVKAEGIKVVSLIKERRKNCFVVADLKTLDAAEVEVELAYKAGADAVVVSGLAPEATVRSFINSCKKRGLASFVDALGSTSLEVVARKSVGADVLVVHRGIDEEASGRSLGLDAGLRSVRSYGFKVGVAGGIRLEYARTLLRGSTRPDILIVGRDIVAHEDPRHQALRYLRLIEECL